jgi:hypothetical protein
MHLIADFFIGALLCNCIPHIVAGLQGMPFPTPFATPRGVGRSSPLVNFLWGLANLLVAMWLLRAFPLGFSFSPEFALALLGALLLGIYLALRFGRVQATR